MRGEHVETHELLGVLNAAHRLLHFAKGLVLALVGACFSEPFDLLAERASVGALEQGTSLWHTDTHLEARLTRV